MAESPQLKTLGVSKESLTWEQGLQRLIGVPLESILIDKPLPFPVYLRISDQFVLFRSNRDTLTGNRAERLHENVDTVFIPKEAAALHQMILEETVTSPFNSDPAARALGLRHMLLTYQQIVERQGTLTQENLSKFQMLGFRIADNIADSPKLSLTLLRRYKDPTLYHVNHSINVAIYSAAVAFKLNLPLKEIRLLTFASLVHNVGNLFIPRDVLYKSGELTRTEWQKVQEHPQKGSELLQRLFVPREVALTALQHHERVDGKGYPYHQRSGDIHTFAKICSIADVYDALTNRAPYKDALMPETAVFKMRNMLGKFEPQILNMMATSR